MYKVAICDDDKSYIQNIKAAIYEYRKLRNKIDFYEYCSGEELLQQADILHDLIFMDMQMPGMDGNNTAKRLRETNKEAILVFCTNYAYPTPEAFKVQPFRYIMKDLHNKMLKEEMGDILEEMCKKLKKDYLAVTRDGGLIKVPLKDILYISIIKRGSIIYLDTERGVHKVTCREKLRDLYYKIQEDGFEYAHNSYIVNLSNIIGINKTLIVLKNQIELNISRSKKEQFDKSFSYYLHTEYKRT